MHNAESATDFATLPACIICKPSKSPSQPEMALAIAQRLSSEN